MMKLSIPADGNRGKKLSEVEPGLHDPRFLPFGDVGIGRPEPTGDTASIGKHEIGWIPSGPGVLGPTAGGHEGRTCIQGRLEGCIRHIPEKEI